MTTPSTAPAAGRGAVTAVILTPRWRLGRRAAALRAVQAGLAAWTPRARRVLVAAQAAAAPALRAAAGERLLIVPESDSPLSAVACLLEACPDDPLLVLAPNEELADEVLAQMLAALQDGQAAAVALVHPLKRLLPFPLLVRPAARPLIDALLDSGSREIADLMRRPAARTVLVG